MGPGTISQGSSGNNTPFFGGIGDLFSGLGTAVNNLTSGSAANPSVWQQAQANPQSISYNPAPVYAGPAGSPPASTYSYAPVSQNQSYSSAPKPTSPAPTNNSNQPNLTTQQAQAAGQVSAAQIQAAQDMYNNLRGQIEAQKGQIQNAYNTGLSDLNTQIAQAQAQGTQQKSDLTNQTNNAINTAYENYRSMLGQNNRMAGAFGGLNSGLIEANNQAGRSYGNNVAGMQNDLTSRTQAIDQNLLAMNQQAEAQKKSLADELQNGILKISLDENANDFQKADAIQKIQADYANQLANINSQQQTFMNQLALAKQQALTYMSMLGKSTQGFDPLSTANNGFINPAQLGTTGPGTIGLTGSNAPIDWSKIYAGIYGTDINGNPTITGQ